MGKTRVLSWYLIGRNQARNSKYKRLSFDRLSRILRKRDDVNVNKYLAREETSPYLCSILAHRVETQFPPGRHVRLMSDGMPVTVRS